MKIHEKGQSQRTMTGSSMLVIGLCSVALAQEALAQEADKKSDPEEVETVMVTGSRIAGVAPVGATVTTLGREEIENAGQVTLDRMIQELPQVLDLGISENSRAQSGGNGNATWSNSINLRGLSPFSTLIITDGHRMTTNGRAISPSVLPTLGVERIEVIADGASAIYGSDAVAGVVNLIPRRNFNGVEAFTRYGADDSGDFSEWNAGFAAGKVFDRGQVMIAYEHAFRSNLSGSDRSWFTSDQRPFGGPDYRTTQCSPGTLTYSNVNYALPAQLTATNANSLVAGTTNLCDLQAGMDLFPEQKYDSVNATSTFEIAPGIEFTFDGYHNKREFVRAPGALTSTITVPQTNAFFVAPSFYTPGSGGYRIAYNFQNDVPQNDLYGFQKNWQATPGLRIDLPHDWSFEGKYGFGKARDRADASSGIVTAALTTALASSNPATAFDPYGLGRTTAATLALIFDADATFPTDAELKTAQAGFNGPLFAIPGGQVKAATGYERQDFTMILGAGTATVRTFNRKVDSGYVELMLPLVGTANARSGIQELEFTAALRHDKYSDVGGTTNPKFGLNYVPVEGLKFRASYGTSFRAPSFPEVFGNSTALYIQPYQNPSGSGTIPGYTLGSGPNPDLGPETATTWTIGTDFEPVAGLTVGLTYFDILYKDTISNLLSNLAVLTYADEYAGTDTILFGQAAYDRITDIVANGVGNSGPVAFRSGPSGFPPGAFDCSNGTNIPGCVFIDGRSLNLGRSRMQGVDFNLQYVMSVGSADTLTFQANGTYLTAYDVAFTPGGAFKDLLNNIYQPLKFKARASVSWDHGPLNARLMLSHVGSYTNDTVAPVQGVGSYTPVDLSLAWRLNESFELGYARSLTLGVEVRNAFDTDPPYVNSRPGANGGGGYDASVASPIGRALAVSLRARF
jgi:iron complex outermembrane receptor protein